CRRSPKPIEPIAPTCSDAASPTSPRPGIATRPIRSAHRSWRCSMPSLARVHWVGESSGGIIGLFLAAAYPERIASLVLCNTPSRIPDHIKRTYALDCATASDAMRAYGVGEWCRQTLGYRLDKERAGEDLCD